MTTTYTFEQLKEDVRKEAEALRVHATREEREKLCFELLNPNNINQCYYGLMCGACDSERAVELISLCTQRFYKLSYDGIQCSNMSRVTDRWSPIELYGTLREAKNANLIAFLKGETDNLEL